jgi:signal transduction histidine kinase
MAASARINASRAELEAVAAVGGLALARQADTDPNEPAATAPLLTALFRRLNTSPTSKDAVRAATDTLFALFNAPVAIWQREDASERYRLGEVRGLDPKAKAALQKSMMTLPPWLDLSDRARDALMMRFGLIAGRGAAAAAGGSLSTILLAEDGTEAAIALDAVSGVLEHALEYRTVVAQLDRREDDFDVALAWASHELRGPVQTTKHVLHHVMERGNLEEEEIGLVRRAETALGRLSDDVKAILQWALSRGTGSLNPMPIDLDVLVASALDSIVGPDERTRIAMELEPGVEIVADPAHLRGAVANLVRNALDYSPPGSKVRVSLERAGPEAVVRIFNDGSLPRSERRQVFRLFARGSAGTSQSTGAGIGLFVADRVVRAHQGRILVESTGKETTFSVWLPTVTA